MYRSLRSSPIACALVAFLGIACHRGNTTTDGGALPPPSFLEVDNLNRLDVVIYLLRDGVTRRLGSASSFKVTRFELRLPPTSLGDIRFVAEPTGARSGFTRRATSDMVVVKPGYIVLWRLESDLQRSMIEVRAAGTAEPDSAAAH